MIWYIQEKSELLLTMIRLLFAVEIDYANEMLIQALKLSWYYDKMLTDVKTSMTKSALVYSRPQLFETILPTHLKHE